MHREGFLSARFSREQFLEMDRDLAVIVAAQGERIAGYLCASSVELNRRIPLLAAMMGRYPDLRFGGEPVDQLSSFVYGPVCIDHEFRGAGVLTQLYQTLLTELAGRFDVGVAFVSKDNPRSLAAHVSKLGMCNVGDFELNGKHYWIVAFAVPPKP
jgi:hypothetical protein